MIIFYVEAMKIEESCSRFLSASVATVPLSLDKLTFLLHHGADILDAVTVHRNSIDAMKEILNEHKKREASTGVEKMSEEKKHKVAVAVVQSSTILYLTVVLTLLDPISLLHSSSLVSRSSFSSPSPA